MNFVSELIPPSLGLYPNHLRAIVILSLKHACQDRLNLEVPNPPSFSSGVYGDCFRWVITVWWGASYPCSVAVTELWGAGGIACPSWRTKINSSNVFQLKFHRKEKLQKCLTLMFTIKCREKKYCLFFITPWNLLLSNKWSLYKQCVTIDWSDMNVLQTF